ncbi:hypothetical protein IscW_ISCW023203 [Ixodes scapularis]|uniref:Uncharacterized protein n=1 Tax=Ixodes scapularis TaxID=6945 RepID=B7QM37_IXOSC|nr:hypothetical protein IscW_ISCW023203 [Ixodes scapularis]|eukprot:XP_002416242.1 hypothetical protein IscW_ISCW023203 [Ixodes scapularis]
MTRRFGDLWVGRHSFPGRPRVRSRKPGPFHLSMAGCGGGLTPELPSVGYELELDAPQPQTPGSTTPESAPATKSMTHPIRGVPSCLRRPERLCSVCNLGETSPMGQGRLVRFEPTLGFQPFRRAARLHRSGSLDQDRSPGATLRRGRAHSPRLQRWGLPLPFPRQGKGSQMFTSRETPLSAAKERFLASALTSHTEVC